MGHDSGTVLGPLTNDELRATPVDGIVDVNNSLYSSFSPDPMNTIEGPLNARLDGSGRLETHSTVVTDEGSFRDDFSGASLFTTLTGTVTFTNNSDVLLGVGTLFTTEVKRGQYIKKTTDAETLIVRVGEIISDTEISLDSVYTGTTATVSAHITNWQTATGSGSFSVTNSIVTVNSGTAASSVELYRDADYGPFTISFRMNISQRIANQTIVAGVQTPAVGPTRRAVFQFSGTDNTLVSCISASSSAAADTQTTTVTLPNNLTSAANIEYAINVSNDQITFVINGVAVAKHRDHIVGAYDFLQTVFQHISTAVVTNTTINVDWVNFYNINQVEIANNFIGEPLVIDPVAIVENKVATYSAGSASFVMPATPTDIFTITGSATKVVRIKKICFGASATNPVNYNIFVVKRSTANSGGTAVTETAVPMDSDDGAATAVARHYTANPTLGTTVGTIRSYRFTVPQTTPLGGATNGPLNEINFGNNSGKSLILRGTSEVLAINGAAVTLTGNSVVAWVEWTEESI